MGRFTAILPAFFRVVNVPKKTKKDEKEDKKAMKKRKGDKKKETCQKLMEKLSS